MADSIIISGPSKCGKTHNAARIANHFGLSMVYDNWDGGPFPAFDTLVLTNRADVPNSRSYAAVMVEVEFAEAKRKSGGHS